MVAIYCYMHLRIHSYVGVASQPERIDHIMCDYRGGLLRVDLGNMSEQDIANELRFSQITDRDNVIIRVRYGLGKPQFDRFMPGLDQPDTQLAPSRRSLRITTKETPK